MFELEKETYTKEEVQEMFNQYDGKINELDVQLTDIKSEYMQTSKELESMEELKKNYIDTSIRLAMSKAGIGEDLFELVVSDDIETAQSKIQKILEINKHNIIAQSYKPQEHKSASNAYEIEEKKGNVQGMLKSKFAKMFG